VATQLRPPVGAFTITAQASTFDSLTATATRNINVGSAVPALSLRTTQPGNIAPAAIGFQLKFAFGAIVGNVQIDFDGDEVYYDPIEVLFAGPEKFELRQNYPNPFNPLTVIPYDVATRTHVRLDLFNILGQRVQTLVNEVRNPGSYKLNFNAANLGSGMYLIRYSAEGRTFVKKMLLVK